MQNIQPAGNTRLAVFWAVLGALGTLAGFPYLIALNSSVSPPPLPLPVLVGLSALQSGFLLFALSWIGLRLGRSIKLDTPLARAWVNHSKLPALSASGLKLALVSGTVGGLGILGLASVFQPWMPQSEQFDALNIALWKRILACFYGGITEEILVRLFLMTLLVWVFGKLGLRAGKLPSRSAFWTGMILAALLFGIGHLPAAAAIWNLTPIVIIRTLVLNTPLGIAFGWLYWQWGLEYAILSHFCADVVVHILGGS